MQFVYRYARLPRDHELLSNIDSAASRLHDKLQNLDVASLPISDYNERYLGNKLKGLPNTLRELSFALSWAIASSDIPVDELVLLDYGGGSGTMSLLAKELNMGAVIYNDIYDVSCRDARVIAESIGNQADYYVQGDIDDVMSFLRRESISCTTIVSSDVIEHIYDIEGFLRKLRALSDGSLGAFMSSDANMLHPLKNRSLMRMQVEAEYKRRDKRWGHKERDCLRAYSDVREEMIRGQGKGLTEHDIQQLVAATRGMMERDIKDWVDRYVAMGELPPEPNHATNTCDPYTGNWAEHLMDPYLLRDILSEEGFQVEVLGGYYGRPRSAVKRIVADSLNLAIHAFRRQGIRIAPFFALCARRDRP